MAEYIVGIADDSTQDIDRLHREYAVNGMIVRCRDCVHYQDWGISKICMRLGSYYGDNRPDWFCADGERKEKK